MSDDTRKTRPATAEEQAFFAGFDKQVLRKSLAEAYAQGRESRQGEIDKCRSLLKECAGAVDEALEWCEEGFVVLDDVPKRQALRMRIDAALADGCGQ